MEITISNIRPDDYAVLTRLFNFLSGSGIAVTTQEPAPPSPRQKRAPKARAEAAAPAAAPEPVDETAILERFSGWHASQKDANGKGKHYTRAQVSHYLPLWNQAKAEYLAAAGSRAASGRTFKSWSINQFKRETEALAPADSEGSPSAEAAPKPKRATKKAAKKSARARRIIRKAKA